MTSGIQSKGVDLDSIFDPYVTGTSPGLTGVQTAGVDIHTRYAPLVYGTQAAATGIACKVGGAGSFVDLNTLFAAKGTAKYSLPINGKTYTALATSGGISPIKTARGSVIVQVGAGQYNVQTSVSNHGGSPIVNNNLYAVPQGMAYFYMTFTNTSQGIGGSILSPPSGWTAIPDSLTGEGSVTTINNSNNGTQITQATVNLYFGAASGVPVWSGSFLIRSGTDIST